MTASFRAPFVIVSRSEHPQTSFAALGLRTTYVVAVHDLECQLGETRRWRR